MSKKLIIVAIIATAFLSAVAIFLFFNLKGDDVILYKVPNDATSILVLDVPTLAKKLFIDEFGKENKSTLELSKSIPDSLADINWDKSGLNFMDKLVLFTIEDADSLYLNCILQISDNQAFDLFINELANKLKCDIEKEGKIQYVYYKSMEILLAWNSKHLIGMKTSFNTDKSKTILKKILSTNKEQSIMSDSNFSSRLNAEYDVMLYSKPYQKCPLKQLEFLNSNIEHFVSFINFNDGDLQFVIEAKSKPESLLDRVFTSKNDDFSSLSNSDSSIVNIFLNVNPESFNKIFRQFNSVSFKESEIPYLKAWNGKINLSLNGIKTIENEYISYEFDDNFNKIEIKKTKQDKIWDLQAIVGFNEAKLDSIFIVMPPSKNGKDTLLFKGGNYVLKKAGTNYVTYNKQLDRPSLKNESANNKLMIEIDYQKLVSVLKEFDSKNRDKWLKDIPITKFTLTAYKDETIRFSSKFHFIDKKKNSLLCLLEYLKSKDESLNN